jgi:hypothetical protein
MPLLLSKYLATRIIPGVVLKPTPSPVKRPNVIKRVSTLGARLLSVIPMKQNRDPTKVTFLQLYFWHNALAKGAMANARVVMLAGIQAANVTEDSGKKRNRL